MERDCAIARVAFWGEQRVALVSTSGERRGEEMGGVCLRARLVEIQIEVEERVGKGCAMWCMLVSGPL